MNVSEKISQLRKEKGWSQEELGFKMNVSRQSISKWENGTSLPDLDKIVKLSLLFGVSTDYLLQNKQSEKTEENTISKEELDSYFQVYSMVAKKYALATSFCILSPALLILLAGLADCRIISESAAIGIGMCALLILVTIGVVLFISNGFKISKYKFLKYTDVKLDTNLKTDIYRQRDAFMPVYSKKIALGTALCILSIIPLFIGQCVSESDIVYIVCVDLLLILVSAGVYLFVKYEMVKDSYDKVLQVDAYTIEKKQEKKIKIGGPYWLIVTALYMGFSFLLNDWSKTWIIWPISALLFVCILEILKIVHKK